MDLSADSLRHIEIGASRPSLTKLYRIALALNVSLDYLTGRSPDHGEILIDERYRAEMVPLIASHL